MIEGTASQMDLTVGSISLAYAFPLRYDFIIIFIHQYMILGRGGLVVERPTAVLEDPGSNLTAAGRLYHDSHCDIQPCAWVVHPYCSA